MHSVKRLFLASSEVPVNDCNSRVAIDQQLFGIAVSLALSADNMNARFHMHVQVALSWRPLAPSSRCGCRRPSMRSTAAAWCTGNALEQRLSRVSACQPSTARERERQQEGQNTRSRCSSLLTLVVSQTSCGYRSVCVQYRRIVQAI